MRIKESTRLNDGRGRGFGKEYKPWIKTRELNSKGTACDFPDWKTGRMISLLSQAELYVYVKLRWDDSVVDIREQFPLEKDRTDELAEILGVRKFDNGRSYMTTDFLVTTEDEYVYAVSVKVNNEAFSSERSLELLSIEKLYWNDFGIPLKLAFKEDVDRNEVMNILDVVSCYDISHVHSDYDCIRHLISRKLICVDMTSDLDYKSLICEWKGSNVWKKTF